MSNLSSSSVSNRSNPVGFRFHPSDEELISFYLTNMVLGRDSVVQDIANVGDICEYEPWELPRLSALESDDEVWYFFCKPNHKYKNSTRSNRTTNKGYWKATGKQRKIKAENSTRDVIGKKKTLVFYLGSIRNGDGKRTSWVMHEYELTSNIPNQTSFVLCKLKKKDDAPGDEYLPSYHPTPVAVEDENEIPRGTFDIYEAGAGQNVRTADEDVYGYMNSLPPLQSQMYYQEQQASSSWNYTYGLSSGYDATQNHYPPSINGWEDEFCSSFFAGYPEAYPGEGSNHHN
ncbi:hypothetical protein SLEP1_g45349 [Rubroshorea leprosula]|uniref:NAC domain-containing protein n=1 Tax=Rubroshorea leprosula TaxID=152421 RepID=A0AAV5LJH3_9ROSI|nr:hypothetical protein SLEP1_g45349 [Rubroshorea leprosula]